MKKHCVLSLSGGADSSSLLLRLLNDGYEVTALSFDIGQRHKIELERATELVNYLNGCSQKTEQDQLGTITIIGENFPLIKHQIIKLDGLSNLLVSGLIDNDSMEMKKGHYAHENALTTVVPNRNAIFAAITYAVALSIVKHTGEKCQIALGTHMGDFDNKTQTGIYPDCSEEFRVALEHAFKIGNWDSEKVDYYAPYNTTDKTGVIGDGVGCCKELGLDYKEIYSRTNTSYAPIKIILPSQKSPIPGEEIESGKSIIWLSDYKSGSSIERIISFSKLGLEDPLQYAEEDGTLVSWDFVEKYAWKLEEEFNNSLK
jgi:7-cyano-7-deazaguanine synthase